ncbi:MAG: hypothetical protein M3O34_07680 [Chloroflexota bacterium]|nr:hypothetical protein [Chloroflexota bacterium]
MNWEPSDRYHEWEGCIGCVHYRHAHCVAYPTRIPLIILDGQVDHMVPRPGQVGETVFEPIDVEHWRLTGERRPRRSAEGRAAVASTSDGATE